MYVNTFKLRNGSYPPTAIRLAEALDWSICNVQWADRLPGYPVVNWGMHLVIEDCGVILGEYKNVLNYCAPWAKDIAFTKMEVSNVSVPRFMLGPVVRRRLRHSQGRDIRRFSNNCFFVEEIDKVEEYRIEVFKEPSSETLKAFRGHTKFPIHSRQEQPFNWNRTNTTWESHGYRSLREHYGMECLELAKEAVKALEYDFGAVDIIKDRSGRLYVLEVNSAPHLEDEGIAKYVWRINRWVNSL